MSSGLFVAEAQSDPTETAQRVITVRLPKGLHIALKEEAYSKKVSLNTLCLSKLRPVPAEPEMP